MTQQQEAVVTVERRDGPYGEVVLRRREAGPGERFEIIANGVFLMDTSDGRSERLLVDAALDALGADGTAPRVLIGGLGVGFSLARAAAEPRWAAIDVVEREPAVIDWHRGGPLARFSAGALDDPRVRVLERDLVAYLREPGTGSGDGSRPGGSAGYDTYDALCLDIDNGPDWTVTENNGSLYHPSGLTACRERLNPGGVLAVWSARPSAGFETALRVAGFDQVYTHEVPVTRGAPDAVHVAVRATVKAT